MKSMTKVWIVAAFVLMAAMLVTPVAARTSFNQINQADTIFWYEKNLDLNTSIPGAKVLVHYTSDVGIGNATNDKIVIDNASNFNVPMTKFEDTYYILNQGETSTLGWVTIAKPYVLLDVVNGQTLVDKLNDRSVTKGTDVAFRLRSNVPSGNFTTAQPPYLELRFTSPNTGQTRIFGTQSINSAAAADYSTTNLTSQDFYTTATFGFASNTTDVVSGVWQVRAMWAGLNASGGCTLGFCDFYGEGVDSNTVSFTMSSGQVVLGTNKDSVIRTKGFALTITGRGNFPFTLYVEDAALDCHEYPWIPLGQPGVTTINRSTPISDAIAKDEVNFDIPNYRTCNPANNLESSYIFKANVTTTAAGTRTVEWMTNDKTNDRTYTFRVVQNSGLFDVDDTVTVKVSKGAVTVDAAGDKTYFMGEEIVLSGENTDSDIVYLYMVGPNLCACGAPLVNPGNFLASGTNCGDAAGITGVSKDVKEDNSFEYKWDTSDLGLDAGTYTVYAVSTRDTKCFLTDRIYDTVSVTLRKPFLSAQLPSPVIAKGDDLIITGTAEGNPDSVFVWIFGTNIVRPYVSENVETDNTFEHKITGTDTQNWASGQYFVVVQHPMYNGMPDIILGGANNEFAFNRLTNQSIFKVSGPGRLMGSDGAQALVEALNSPNVDDSLTKLYFELKEPSITIEPISDKYIGDKFTISGTTNLAVDDTFTVTVTSASFKPTDKEQAGEFSGVAETTKVVKGTGAANTWSVQIDTSPFKPDQYLVKVECIETGTTATTDFFVSEVPPTPTPTAAPPTTVPVTTAPPATTPPKTTVPPTTTPGFGAVIALIGLGAVAVLVLRRH